MSRRVLSGTRAALLIGVVGAFGCGSSGSNGASDAGQAGDLVYDLELCAVQ